MEFTASRDIEAPIGFVFDEVSHFSTFERQALRRGAEVKRRDSLEQPGVGVGWDVVFTFRGKERQISAEVTEFDRPNGYRVQSIASSLETDLVVDLLPLSKGRTRINVTVRISAKNLGAKLMLQSFRVARSTLNNKFQQRIDKYAMDIAEKHAGKTAVR